jgi:putative endonuclease|tara:strand:+ start:3590 stop:4048 length:459 start_codon:yes stop_codon:yes gene_type:complete
MGKKIITSNTSSKSKPLLKTLSDFILKKRIGRAHQSAHLTTGKQGEKVAANYLKKNGYKILDRNYHCKFGEIDIIALEGDILTFIEIKTRSSREHIPPEFAVTKHKQSKIKRSACHYLGKHCIENRDCRFDIVAITMEKGKKDIVLYKNAFS